MNHHQTVGLFLASLVAVLVFPSSIADNKKWDKSVQRMIGGTPTNIDNAPYAVQIRTIRGQFGCGGTLVTAQHVVTAAHCLVKVDPVRHLFVVAGVSATNGKGVFRKVVDAFKSSEYLYPSYHADIAVLKLDSPIPEDTFVHSIPLCTKTLQPGDVLKVSGWGRTAGNGPLSTELRSIEFPVITLEECSKKLNLSDKPTNIKFSDTMVCGLAPKEGPCEHDSGGPAVHNGELCGVVSWGKKNCVYDDTPAVYTSVAAMRSFLEGALKK